MINLHLSPDDKFLDYFIKIADENSITKNVYCVFAVNKKIIYTKTLNKIEVYDYTVEAIAEVLAKYANCHNVYLHSLQTLFIDALNNFNFHRNRTIVWLFFGNEIFSLRSNIRNFFMPLTKKFFLNNTDIFFRWSYNPIQLRRNIINYKYYSQKEKIREYNFIKAVSKIDYFAHYLESDFMDYVKPMNKKIKFLYWFYGIDINSNKISMEKRSCNYLSILLGHSGSFFNNHFDALYSLYRLKPENTNIRLFTPLSYSGTQDYNTSVISYGTSLFDKDFNPILNFMHKETYYQNLSEIDLFCFYNYRSMAGGNIVWAIMNYKPIFLSEKSNLFHYFVSNGLKIFSVEKNLVEFINNPALIKINASIFADNSKIIQELFGSVATKKRYTQLLSI